MIAVFTFGLVAKLISAIQYRAYVYLFHFLRIKFILAAKFITEIASCTFCPVFAYNFLICFSFYTNTDDGTLRRVVDFNIIGTSVTLRVGSSYVFLHAKLRIRQLKVENARTLKRLKVKT